MAVKLVISRPQYYNYMHALFTPVACITFQMSYK